MRIDTSRDDAYLNSNWHEKSYLIFLSSVFVVILFEILPMSPGHELALAYVPLFFLCLSLILTLLYWFLKKIFKRKLLIIYYLFFSANLLFDVYMTVGMFLDQLNYLQREVILNLFFSRSFRAKLFIIPTDLSTFDS